MLSFKNAQQISAITLLDRAFHYGDGCFTYSTHSAWQN